MAETPSPAFQAFMASTLAKLPLPLEILEVGGGPQTFVHHPQARYTVLELTQDTLATSHYADERLIGDAQTFNYGGRRFGVVVFWNVLEHIRDPLRALTRAGDTLGVGGLLVVRGPALRSLKSIITRMTPHWIHVLFYRLVLHFPAAGQPGHAPFPIEHAPGADAEEIDRQSRGMRLERIFADDYVGDQLVLLSEYSRILHGLYMLLSRLLRWATGSRWGSIHSDFVRVYRRVG